MGELKKRALITGVTGQDGAYLSKLLLQKGYEVYGTVRRTSTPNFWRLQELEMLNKVTLASADLSDMASLMEVICRSNPDEIYNLGAQSFVLSSFDQPIHSADINGLGLIRILEIVRSFNPRIKVYQASTSELYGGTLGTNTSQNERTPFKPNSPYALSKLFAFELARIYRESYGLFVCNGILYNHESELRGLEFVTRKVTNEVAKIKLGLSQELRLGNLDAVRDWGYAPEYVEAMWAMMQQEKPDDFVVATNEVHSVKELVEVAFDLAGLEWKKYLKRDEQLLRPYEVEYLRGDYSKIEQKLGWKPKTTFHELIRIMLEADLERWKKHLQGVPFGWDAPNLAGQVQYLYRTKNKVKPPSHWRDESE